MLKLQSVTFYFVVESIAPALCILRWLVLLLPNSPHSLPLFHPYASSQTLCVVCLSARVRRPIFSRITSAVASLYSPVHSLINCVSVVFLMWDENLNPLHQ